MDLIEQGLVAEKMSALWKKREPGKLGAEPRNISAGSNVRIHSPGIESLQYGRGVGHTLRLDQPGVQEQYERIKQEAKEGKLASIDLLVGFTESHEDSGVFGNLAYMITTASHPPNTYVPSNQDFYDNDEDYDGDLDFE